MIGRIEEISRIEFELDFEKYTRLFRVTQIFPERRLANFPTARVLTAEDAEKVLESYCKNAKEYYLIEPNVRRTENYLELISDRKFN